MTTFKQILPALLLFFVMACGGGDKQTVPDPEIGMEYTERPFLLYGSSWKLASVNDREPAADMRNHPRLAFDYDGEKVSGNAGCNSFHGGYNLGDDGKLSFDQMATTKMSCEHMDMENEVLAAFQQTERFELRDGQLLLKKGDDVLAVFDPAREDV